MRAAPARESRHECTVGTRLHAATDTGTQTVCNSDPYCCTVEWDAICVREVGSLCGRSCP